MAIARGDDEKWRDLIPSPVPAWGPSADAPSGSAAWNQRGPDELRHNLTHHLVLCSFLPCRNRETRLAGSKLRTVASGPLACEVVPAGADYWARWHQQKEVAVYSIGPAWLAELASRCAGSANLELEVDALPFRSPAIAHLATMLRREFQLAGGVISPLYVDSMMTLVGMELVRGYSSLRRRAAKTSGARLTPKALARVTEYVRANLSQQITLDNLSSLTGYSLDHFLRAFKSDTGKTPHQFVLDLRLELAEYLLRSSESSIAEIADKAGFSSQAHLTSLMRRLRQTTPAAYRRAVGSAKEHRFLDKSSNA